MLYWLHNILDIHLLGYITIRAGISFFLALIFTLFFMPKFIRWAQKTSRVQPINAYAPNGHSKKDKTSTMGGIVFIMSAILASLLTIKFSNLYAVFGIIVLGAFMLIGFKDDLAKIKYNENTKGLKPLTKIFLQTIVAGIISLFLFSNFNTELYVPFLKNPIFDMQAFSILFWILVIVATSNAVNLTDGLDGLATVPSIAALTTFSVIIYVIGHVKLSSYLLLPNLNIGELVIVSSALMGALTGFLWYNCHPAEVFMGDSGSLGVGAFLGFLAIVTKSEILLFLIGSIFVIETLSVIVQVGSYKLRKKRVFLMAPIHHHFEMKNWSENKIIVRFWIIAVLSNLVALISLKIR